MKNTFLVLISIILIRPLFGQHQTKAVKTDIDRILTEQCASGNLPGAVAMVSVHGKIIHHAAYGYARKFDKDWKPLTSPEPMTTAHLFDIASLTKVTGTTTAIMLLTDRKKIGIDDPVKKYLPEFTGPSKDSVTIRHLLSHLGGLFEWYPMYYKSSDRKTTLALICSLPLRWPVGKQRKYSDLGFTLLGAIVEKVSGVPLEQFVEQEIFTPLGMNNTFYLPNNRKAVPPRVSTSFGNPYEFRMVHDPSLGFQRPEIDPESWNNWRTYTLTGEVNDGNTWYAGQGVSGAAGLFSTASDLMTLTTMLMNHGKINGRTFISENTIKQFLTKDRFNNDLGWMMDSTASFMKDAPHGSFGHTGFTGTSIVAVPSKKLIVILLTNRQHRGLLPDNTYYNVGPVRQRIFEATLKSVK
ncbi:MAG: serine hydrolase domain-containing protein [Bacteroidota bacterium]